MWKTIGRTLVSKPLPIGAPAVAKAHLEQLARQLDERARSKLGRSLSIREVDAGSCNGCELEIHALNNPYYDLERFGLSAHQITVLSAAATICSTLAGCVGYCVGVGGAQHSEMEADRL